MATCTFLPLQDLVVRFERQLSKPVGQIELVPVYVVHLLVRSTTSLGWYCVELQRVPTLEEAHAVRMGLYRDRLHDPRLLNGWAGALKLEAQDA